MTTRLRGALWARLRAQQSLSGGAATWSPRAAGRERMPGPDWDFPVGSMFDGVARNQSVVETILERGQAEVMP